ncbi:MAG: response regulator [Gammaproteobacteria bacterium]
MQTTIAILVIDDEAGNLEIIGEYLEDEHYEIVTAQSGEAGLQILTAAPEKFQAILLDWMMPGMNGMEVLATLKSDPLLRHIPVVMQTARTAHEDLLQGMHAGAFYYLTKPYQQQTLTTILAAALADAQRYTELRQKLLSGGDAMRLLTQAQFRFRTLEEAQNLVSAIAQATPEPERLLMGLSELLINAIEHGNLGIGYAEKSRLNAAGEWYNEIQRRLADAAYQDKFATLDFSVLQGDFVFTITDQGDGFDHRGFLEMDASRAYDSHGRGIYMARLMSFDKIEYRHHGTQVIATMFAPRT